MALLVTFFLLAILFSFLCSILEAVLLSVTPYYVSIQEQDQTAIAPDLSRFKADIDRPLAAILTLNTIANTLGAVGVGSQAAVVFGSTSINLLGLSLLSWEAVIAGGMTLCILVFSEVIPKTIGANNWEKLTPFAVRTLKVLLFVLAPFVWLSQFITMRLKKDKSQPVLTRADFLKITNIGRESGALGESERRIILNLLRFNHILVEDIMTPGNMIVTAKSNMKISEFHEQYGELPYTGIPVYEEDTARIAGYVHKDELLIHLITSNDDLTFGDIIRNILTVDRQMAVPDLLDKFLHNKEYMALVSDEGEPMSGVVTIEDIIETVLGLEDINDEQSDWQTLAREILEKRMNPGADADQSSENSAATSASSSPEDP